MNLNSYYGGLAKQLLPVIAFFLWRIVDMHTFWAEFELASNPDAVKCKHYILVPEHYFFRVMAPVRLISDWGAVSISGQRS